jgi:hypothetical protein
LCIQQEQNDAESSVNGAVLAEADSTAVEIVETTVFPPNTIISSISRA